MTYSSYLIKNHNNVYYFRYIIPKQYKAFFPNHQREIRKSLKTKDLRKAKIKAMRFRVYMSDYFEKLDKMEAEGDARDAEREAAFLILRKLDNLGNLEDSDITSENERLEDFIASLTTQQRVLMHKHEDAYLEVSRKRNQNLPIQQNPIPPPSKWQDIFEKKSVFS